MNNKHGHLSYTLCRLTGRPVFGLPDIQAYTNYINYRDEEIRQKIREEDKFSVLRLSSLSVVHKCQSNNDCEAIVYDESYNLCRPHNELRQELKVAYHLTNQVPPIQAWKSLVFFREVQLRQIYLERYSLRPNTEHDDWILTLVSEISWKEMRMSGELQRDAYVHRALNRPYSRTPSDNFKRFRLKLCHQCGCRKCERRFPDEFAGKYLT